MYTPGIRSDEALKTCPVCQLNARVDQLPACACSSCLLGRGSTAPGNLEGCCDGRDCCWSQYAVVLLGGCIPAVLLLLSALQYSWWSAAVETGPATDIHSASDNRSSNDVQARVQPANETAMLIWDVRTNLACRL